MNNATRKMTLAFATLASVGVALSQLTYAESEKKAENKLEGTCWRLVAMKYGDANEFTNWPETLVSRRVFSKTHLIWVDYDQKTGLLGSSAGGTYTVEGNSITLNSAFASEHIKQLVNKEEKLNIRVDGKKLFLSGTFSWGLKMEEVWEKIE